MSLTATARAEAPLAAKYSLVACLGFITDLTVLKLATDGGMSPAWARVISLTCAMQATFWVNGLFVFRCLTRKGWVSAWLGYMATSGLGNVCNYWVFVTLVSLHHPILSNHTLDLVVGGIVAWAINFACARYLIFGAEGSAGSEGCTPIQEIIRRISGRLGGRRADLDGTDRAVGR